MNLGDYCGRCFAWIWGKGCKCGRFQNGVNVEGKPEKESAS